MARYRIGLCWTENLLYYGKNGVFFGKSFDYRIVEPAAYDRWMQLKGSSRRILRISKDNCLLDTPSFALRRCKRMCLNSSDGRVLVCLRLCSPPFLRAIRMSSSNFNRRSLALPLLFTHKLELRLVCSAFPVFVPVVE